jgi:hypothetical protein
MKIFLFSILMTSLNKLKMRCAQQLHESCSAVGRLVCRIGRNGSLGGGAGSEKSNFAE